MFHASDSSTSAPPHAIHRLEDSEPARREYRIRRFFVAWLVALLAAQATWAQAPSVGALGAGSKVDGLGSALPGYSIVRCLFPRGRLVLEREGELMVLRAGDVIPGANEKTADGIGDLGTDDFRVLEISETRAILATNRVVVQEIQPVGGAGNPEKAAAPVTGVPMPGRIIWIENSAEAGTTITVGSAVPPAGSFRAHEEAGEMGRIGLSGSGSGSGDAGETGLGSGGDKSRAAGDDEEITVGGGEL